MIKRPDLENRGVGLAGDDPDRLPDERPYQGRGRGPRIEEAAGQAPSLQDRLAAARALTPPAGSCRACFLAGRDAAVELLGRAQDTRPLAERLAAAGALRPVHEHGGDPAFGRGRDAAIRVIAHGG